LAVELPSGITTKRNPFRSTETYSPGSALVNNNPAGDGHVAYWFQSQTDPYTILVRGANGVMILTLSAET